MIMALTDMLPRQPRCGFLDPPDTCSYGDKLGQQARVTGGASGSRQLGAVNVILRHSAT